MEKINKLAQEVVSLLGKENKMIFTAESCTAGLISASIANISGSSKVLLGGVVSYDNRIKQDILKVPPATLETHGAVSFESAIEMSKGALELSKADYVIAITGIAGPDGGTPLKPVGTVYIAVLSLEGGWAQQFLLEGTREEIRKESVCLSLQLLLATEREDDFFDLRLVDAREI